MRHLPRWYTYLTITLSGLLCTVAVALYVVQSGTVQH